MKRSAGYTSRPATWDDLDVVVALFRACDLVDVGFEDPVREHLKDDWGRPGTDLEEQTLLLAGPDGSFAGYAMVAGLNPELSLEAFARVHPAHRGRGLGATLVDWTEQRARKLAPTGSASKLHNSVPATDARAERLLASRGYERVRIFWHMERDLAGSIEPVSPPPGIELRSYRHGDDADVFYDAIEDAFADHWGYEPYPRDVHMAEIERYDPELLGLAFEGEDLVGALMSKPLEDGGGWVDMVAVRRPWRGRGIARALLTRAFTQLLERGLGSVALNVDSESPTGATRLYESVGMRLRRAWNLFEKPLGPDVS